MADYQAHDVRLPCSPGDIGLFLEQAADLVKSRGQKLTKIRRRVLELLAEAKAPSKAYDLLQRLDGKGAAKPPTVYRALDFLQEQGLAHKIESLNAFVACGHASHAHSAVFLICDSCGGAEELHSTGTTAALREETAAAGFRLGQAVIEARGLCRSCAGDRKG